MSEDKDRIDFLLDVIKRYDHYIATTNFKVGLMMSFLAAILVGVVTKLTPHPEMSQSFCGHLLLVYIVDVVVMLSSLIAIYFLISAIFPSSGNSKVGESVMNYEDVAKWNGGAAGYHESIKNMNEESILKDISSQVFDISSVVSSKFSNIKKAAKFIKYCTLPALAALIVLINI